MNPEIVPAPESVAAPKGPSLDELYMSFLGLAGVALIALILVRLAQGVAIDWSATFSAMAAIATTGGAAIGGWWALWTFRRQRVGEARMDIAQTSQIWKDADGRLVLRFGVTFRNIGLISLTPMLARSVVHRPPDGMLDSGRQPADYWVEVRAIEHPIFEDEVEIEPGESETYWHDVSLPDDTKIVQVYSEITCEGRDKKFWDETLLVPVVDPALRA